MLRVKLTLNSGAPRVIFIEFEEGVDLNVAAEELAQKMHQIEHFSTKDALSNAWVFVRGSEVSFAEISIEPKP